jgi:hypothetical protein
MEAAGSSMNGAAAAAAAAAMEQALSRELASQAGANGPPSPLGASMAAAMERALTQSQSQAQARETYSDLAAAAAAAAAAADPNALRGGAANSGATASPMERALQHSRSNHYASGAADPRALLHSQSLGMPRREGSGAGPRSPLAVGGAAGGGVSSMGDPRLSAAGLAGFPTGLDSVSVTNLAPHDPGQPPPRLSDPGIMAFAMQRLPQTGSAVGAGGFEPSGLASLGTAPAGPLQGRTSYSGAGASLTLVSPKLVQIAGGSQQQPYQLSSAFTAQKPPAHGAAASPVGLSAGEPGAGVASRGSAGLASGSSQRGTVQSVPQPRVRRSNSGNSTTSDSARVPLPQLLDAGISPTNSSSGQQPPDDAPEAPANAVQVRARPSLALDPAARRVRVPSCCCGAWPHGTSVCGSGGGGLRVCAPRLASLGGCTCRMCACGERAGCGEV